MRASMPSGGAAALRAARVLSIAASGWLGLVFMMSPESLLMVRANLLRLPELPQGLKPEFLGRPTYAKAEALAYLDTLTVRAGTKHNERLKRSDLWRVKLNNDSETKRRR